MSYLPADKVPAFNKEAADFFIKKAKISDEKLAIFCIEKAIQFLQAKEHLEMMSQWVLKEADKVDGHFVLTKEQKYSVLKMYHACAEFTKEQKDALKAVVLKDDTSDEGKAVAKACEMILPDAKLKEELWA